MTTPNSNDPRTPSPFEQFVAGLEALGASMRRSRERLERDRLNAQIKRDLDYGRDG